MNIVIVSQYYSPEPVPIPRAVAQGMAERGHHVRVVTAYPNYPGGTLFEGVRQRWRHSERDGDVMVRRVPVFVSHSRNPLARILSYLSFAASSLTSARFVRQADVVYVYATPMTAAISPSVWSLVGGAPYVLHVQDLWPESVTGSSMVGGRTLQRLLGISLRPWLRNLYQRAAATIALGPTMSRMLQERGAPVDRIHTVLNWATEGSRDTQAARVRSSAVPGLALMYAGNIGEMQDLDTVVRAVALVRDLPGLRVTLVGSGVAEKRLRQLVQDLDLSCIEFLGRVPFDQMSAHYQSSDFQLVTLKDLPIFRATIPSKLQASLAAGIPVITTIAGDVGEIVQSEGLGFTTAPGDVERLAEVLRSAHALSQGERNAMGERAHRHYDRTMSSASGLDTIEKTLIEAARRPDASRRMARKKRTR